VKKTADWIWIPFMLVSEVSRGIGVLDGGGDRRRKGAVYLFVYVCQFANISEKPHVQTREIFWCMSNVAVDHLSSDSDDSAICYVLPVLWMTSRFHAMALQDVENANRAYRYVQSASPWTAPWAKSDIHDCFVDYVVIKRIMLMT